MRLLLLLIPFFLIGFSVFGQEYDSEIYDFGINSARRLRKAERFPGMKEQEKIRGRWVISGDGFFTACKKTYDGDYGGLLVPQTGGSFDFGISFGRVFREEWMIEAGYARTGVNQVWKLDFTNDPYYERYRVPRNVALLRGRRKLNFASKDLRTNGLWLGVAGLVMPGGNSELQSEILRITSERGNGTVDEYMLKYNSSFNSQLSVAAEASAEMVFRVNPWLDLGAFLRINWRAKNKIDTLFELTDMQTQDKLDVKVNSIGSGFSIGISLKIVDSRADSSF